MPKRTSKLRSTDFSRVGRRILDDYAPTSKGSQFDHKAHERIINRKPAARTKDKRITAVCESRSDCVQVRELGRRPTFQACRGHDREQEGMFGRLWAHPFAACIASHQPSGHQRAGETVKNS